MDNNLENRVENTRVSVRVRRQMEAVWGTIKCPLEEYNPFEEATRKIMQSSLRLYEKATKIIEFPKPRYR